MTILTGTASQRQRTFFALALSYALLVVIAYGATAGLVHRHGSAGIASQANPSAQANLSAIGAVNDAGDTNSSARLSFHGNACLICQLHRQLSQGLAHTSASSESPPAQRTSATFVSSVYLSILRASQRGRAPPAASLL